MERVEELLVSPGGEETAQVRLIVRGRSGAAQTSIIRFETNDPTQPEVTIQLIVPFIKNGLIVLPAEVHFGAVLLAATQTREIDLYDDAKTPVTALTVAPLTDPRLTAVFLSPDQHKPPEGQPSYGKHVGRVRVTLNASTPGEVRGMIQLAAVGREGTTTDIPFSAQIHRPIESIPRRLTLAADALTGRVLIRSHVAAVRAVREVSSPVGFVVRPERATDGPIVPCTIAWDGPAFATAKPGVYDLDVPVELIDGSTTSVVVSVEKIAPGK